MHTVTASSKNEKIEEKNQRNHLGEGGGGVYRSLEDNIAFI